MLKFLPILIILAFPMLYIGAKSADTMLSMAGIVVLLLGMSGQIITRIK